MICAIPDWFTIDFPVLSFSGVKLNVHSIVYFVRLQRWETEPKGCSEHKDGGAAGVEKTLQILEQRLKCGNRTETYIEMIIYNVTVTRAKP